MPLEFGIFWTWCHDTYIIEPHEGPKMCQLSLPLSIVYICPPWATVLKWRASVSIRIHIVMAAAAGIWNNLYLVSRHIYSWAPQNPKTVSNTCLPLWYICMPCVGNGTEIYSLIIIQSKFCHGCCHWILAYFWSGVMTHVFSSPTKALNCVKYFCLPLWCIRMAYVVNSTGSDSLSVN